MGEKIINDEIINENEVDEVAVRVKAIIINSDNEFLLAHSYNTYQFPGGHVEANEPLIPALNRELMEETGLDFKLEQTALKPFYSIIHYSRNYRDTGKNRKNIIYYFLIKTNTLYNQQTCNLDQVEQGGDFELLYVPYSQLETLLIKSISNNPINELIVKEMLEILDVIKNRAVIVW